MQNQELIKRIEADGVKFLALQFTDLLGTVKSVDIPAHRVPNALEQGVWFDGSSVEGFARIQEATCDLAPGRPTRTRMLAVERAEERPAGARAARHSHDTDGDTVRG